MISQFLVLATIFGAIVVPLEPGLAQSSSKDNSFFVHILYVTATYYSTTVYIILNLENILNAIAAGAAAVRDFFN